LDKSQREALPFGTECGKKGIELFLFNLSLIQNGAIQMLDATKGVFRKDFLPGKLNFICDTRQTIPNGNVCRLVNKFSITF
jgi:hypothetical protein